MAKLVHHLHQQFSLLNSPRYGHAELSGIHRAICTAQAVWNAVLPCHLQRLKVPVMPVAGLTARAQKCGSKG